MRRPGMAATGMVMMVLGLVALVPVGYSIFNSVDWYHYKPARFVMNDLHTPGVAFRALRELMRRDSNGSLSLDYRRQIVDIALKEQSAATPGPLASQLLDFAAAQYAAGALTDAQKQKLLAQTVQLALQVRPKVPSGQLVAYRVDEKARTPIRWWVNVTHRGVSVDGKRSRGGGGGGGSMSGMGGGGSVGSSVRCDPPGAHQLEAEVRVEVYDGVFGKPDASKQLLVENRKLSGGFEVSSDPQADPIKLIDDAQLANGLKAALAPINFEIGTSDPHPLQGILRIRNCPESVAFNVFARVKGREIPLGSIRSLKGGSTDYSISSYGPIDLAGSASIDVILRSSPAVARDTVDQHELWSGELVFENVPVTGSK